MNRLSKQGGFTLEEVVKQGGSKRFVEKLLLAGALEVVT